MTKHPLDLKDAGSAALGDAQALAQMQATWQANVQQMTQYAQNRGWEVSLEPAQPSGLSHRQLDALEARLGEPLPPQLRHLFCWSGEWRFAWELAEEEAIPVDLSDISDGCLQWSAKSLKKDGLREQMLYWVVEHHHELLEEFAEEDGKQADLEGYTAFWQGHFPFFSQPNGDLLTIDTRNPDPEHQPVRYFFHDLEYDDQHGIVLAPNLFSFISRLTALGCAGSEWGCGWALFWRDDTQGLDSRGKNADKWLKWLAQDPDAIPSGERRPKRVPARSEADRALLLAARDGDLQGVCRALEQGAQPDAEDTEDLLDPNMYAGFSQGQTALVLAARHNRLDMLEALLSAGASLATHELPLPLLMRHAGKERQAHAKTLRFLIERGARIDPWPEER